jgi:hypothetical protein
MVVMILYKIAETLWFQSVRNIAVILLKLWLLVFLLLFYNVTV